MTEFAPKWLESSIGWMYALSVATVELVLLLAVLWCAIVGISLPVMFLLGARISF